MQLPKLQNVWCLNLKFLSSVFPVSRIIIAVALSSFSMQLCIFVSSCMFLCWKDKSSLLLPAMHGIANFKFENSMALTSRAALANVYYIFIFSFQTIFFLFTLLRIEPFNMILVWTEQAYACRYCSLVFMMTVLWKMATIFRGGTFPSVAKHTTSQINCYLQHFLKIPELFK